MKEYLIECIHTKRGTSYYRTFKVLAKTPSGAKKKLEKTMRGAKLTNMEVQEGNLCWPNT